MAVLSGKLFPVELVVVEAFFIVEGAEFLDGGLFDDFNLSVKGAGTITAAGIKASWCAGHCLDEFLDVGLIRFIPTFQG